MTHDSRSRHQRRHRRLARRGVSPPASRSRTALIHRDRRAGGDAAGARDPRCDRACMSCPAPSTSTCISAIPAIPHKEDFGSGTAAAAFGGVTTVFDMPNTVPTIGTPEALADKHTIAAGEGLRRLRPLRRARRGQHRACAGADRRRRHRLQALHGQHVRPHPLALDRRDARSVRGRGADRKAHLAACRDQFDHGAAGSAAARRRPHRADRASRVAAGGRRGRGGGARGDPRRMDRRAHPRAAHLLGRRVAAAAPRPRRAASTSPARPARIICCCPRRTTRNSAASSGSIRRCARRANQQPLWDALARRHHRHDRHRPRAACAGGKDAQRHLDGRLRLSRASRRRCR